MPMNDESPKFEDLHDDLKPMVERIAEERGAPESFVLTGIKKQYGLDLTEVSDDDAEEFAQAMDDGDVGTACDVLSRQGVDEATVEQFRENVRGMMDGGSGNGSSPDEHESAGGEEVQAGNAEPTQNGDSPASEGGLTPEQRQEMKRIAAQATPDASEIAAQLKSEMGGGGGGDEAAMGKAQQQKMALEVLDRAMSGGGGGKAAELGQEFQKEAMKSFLKDMRSPSIGDVLEKRYYEEVLGSDAVEELYDPFLPDSDEDPDEVLGEADEDDEDDESGGLFNF